MKAEMINKINVVAETILSAYGSDCIHALIELAETDADNNSLKACSEISDADIVSTITDIFGDISSMRTIIGNPLCRYLDFDQIEELRRCIRRLSRGTDMRIETATCLRDLGGYFAFLACNMNRGFLGHKEALRLVTCSVAIYDLLQKMMPYIFDDVSFVGTELKVVSQK